MPMLSNPRPIDTLDPTKPALVHDHLNDKIIRWKPEWASAWRDGSAHAPGVGE